MKRMISALALAAALCLSLAPGAGAAFTDISDDTTQTAAAALQGLGVMGGTSDATFSPDETLTRAQMCAMAVNALGLSDQVSAAGRKTLFSDVSPAAWYNGYVNTAYGEGLVNGYGNGTFGPDDPVTYGQVATILLRMLGYTSAEVGSLWPLDYTDFCDELGLSEGLSLSPTGSLTRGEAAVLLYRALLENVNGTQQPCYETIDGGSSTAEAILLDTDAAYGGGSGLLMAYLPDGSGITYYTQGRQQSDALEGRLGTLLFDGAGKAVGFLPDGGEARDVTIGSATASTLTASDGASYRISSGAVVLSGGETYDYSTSGYLQLNSRAGAAVRLFADDTGAIRYLYLAGGTTSASQTAVADTSSAASSLARALGISGRSYAITKNGAAADSGDLAEYDVAYYDAATGTMRASDYKVTGYISAASPNVTAAETITVAGCEFPVLESAWESLEGFRIGDTVTLLLTDDGKAAWACAPSEIRADMVGILSEDGRSVTLCDSGVTLTASQVDYDEDMLGSMVRVSSSSSSTLRCGAPLSNSRYDVDLAAGTMGELELAPGCRIYEWAGSGFVYDLEGNQGSASADFSAIDWLDEIASDCVSYYRTNSAGQVDLILLDSVTGGCYDYGKLTQYEDAEGISAGSFNGQPIYNDAATLTNAAGTTQKYLYNLSGRNRYVGIALGQSATGDLRITAVQSLSSDEAETADFFLQDGDWYVESGRQEFRVSEQVQIHLTGADLWLEGTEGLERILADGYTLTLYYDRPASEGGQIRIITAQ